MTPEIYSRARTNRMLSAWLALAAGCSKSDADRVCAALSTKALVNYHAALTTADRTCQVDSDCVWAHFASTCVVSCPGAEVISARGVAELDALAQAQADGACEEFTRNGCQPEVAPCFEPGEQALCVVGSCVYGVMPTDLGGVVSSGPDPNAVVIVHLGVTIQVSLPFAATEPDFAEPVLSSDAVALIGRSIQQTTSETRVALFAFRAVHAGDARITLPRRGGLQSETQLSFVRVLEQ